MKKLYRYYNRGRHPKGFWGKRALNKMNGPQHAELPEWVFAELRPGPKDLVLDIGCGGGANIVRLFTMSPECGVTGMDLSLTAVEVATDLNYHVIKDGRCVIVGGSAAQMPLARDIFDLAIAFETIYYWPSLAMGFAETMRVLKPGGRFVIANELDGEGEEYRLMENEIGGIRIYTISEISQELADAGFINIEARHDEKRHFICVTAQKPAS